MRSQQYESVLDAAGAEWEYLPSVEIKNIDIDGSLKNQARFEMPLIEALVDEYCAAMRAGDTFPAVVGYRNYVHKYLLIDGNHRLKAAIALRMNAIDMYDVSPKDPRQLQELTYTFNQAVNGARAKPSEALAHAVHLVQASGHTLEEAARLMRLPYSRVQHAVAVDDVYRRLTDLHATPRTAYPATTMAPLANITTDAGLVAAMQAVEDGHLTQNQSAELVRLVRRARTDKAQVEAVEAFRSSPTFIAQQSRFKEGGKAPRRKGVNMSFFMGHISSACSLIRNQTATTVGLTDEQIAIGDKVMTDLTVLWAMLKRSRSQV